VSVYQVTGNTAYRSHPPGSIFEAQLEPTAEQRAIIRRNIRLVEQSTPALLPGSYTLPVFK
jgi:hypothetical protein